MVGFDGAAFAALDRLEFAHPIPAFLPMDRLWPLHEPAALWTEAHKGRAIFAVANQWRVIPISHRPSSAPAPPAVCRVVHRAAFRLRHQFANPCSTASAQCFSRRCPQPFAARYAATRSCPDMSPIG